MPNPFMLPGMADPAWGGQPQMAQQQPQQPPAQPAVSPQQQQAGGVLDLLRQLQQLQQQNYDGLPGQVGAEQGALSELTKLYGGPRKGPDPALLQLAAGFLSPTRTGGFGESLGRAVGNYGGALAVQQEQEFDRAAKLAQLKLTQAQLANRLPEMRLKALSGQVETAGKMYDVQKGIRDQERQDRQEKLWDDALTGASAASGTGFLGDLTPEELQQLKLIPAKDRPAALQKIRESQKLTDKGLETFTGLGASLKTADDLAKGFKPAFAGKTFGVVGDVENWFGSRGRDSVFNGDQGGQDRVDQANWWKGYQEWRNTVRHEKFGASLTPGEKSEFDKQDVSPGDGADVVQQKLARQQQIVRDAIKRTRDGYLAQGKSKKAIDATLGISGDDFFSQPAPGPQGQPAGGGGLPRVTSQAEYDAIPKGTQYLDPNGKQRTKQ